MAAEKSCKNKLTPRQHAFVKNLAKGASQKDAFIAAGYKAKHPDQGAHQALKQIQGKFPQIMDQIGLTDHLLIEKYLVPMLEAEEPKFFRDGLREKKVANWTARATGLDLAFRLKGSYAPRNPKKAQQFGVKVVVVDIPRPPRNSIDLTPPVTGAKGKPPTDDNGQG